MSKRLKLDQVINLLVDDEMSSDDESISEDSLQQEKNVINESSDEDLPLSVLISRNNPSKSALSLSSRQPFKPVKNTNNICSRNSSNDEMQFCVLATKKSRLSSSLPSREPFKEIHNRNELNSDISSDEDLQSCILMVKKNTTSSKVIENANDKSVESSSDDDDIPLAVLCSKKMPSQLKALQQQDSNDSNLKQNQISSRKVDSFLLGLFDSIDLESEDDCEMFKENVKIKNFKQSDSPVLIYDRSVTRFILSMKNLKRKSCN